MYGDKHLKYNHSIELVVCRFFEAYAELPLATNFSAKIGRQVIALDDDRIFGSLDWHPAGRKSRCGKPQLEGF